MNREITSYTTFIQSLEKFPIRNSLLRACVGGYTRIDGMDGTFCGFQSDKRSVGYVVLCSLLEEALAVHRLPYKADRIVAGMPAGVAQELQYWDQFIRQNRQAAVAELVALYEFGQSILAQCFAGRMVPLKRYIADKYAPSLQLRYEAAKLLDKHAVPIEMDLLNSYMLPNDIGYRYPCCIRYAVPIQDVLYAHDFILPVSPNGSHPSDTEEGEWVVINRSEDGIVDLPVSAFSFKNVLPRPLTEREALTVWRELERSALYIRPESNINPTSVLHPVEPPPTKWQLFKQKVKYYCRF